MAYTTYKRRKGAWMAKGGGGGSTLGELFHIKSRKGVRVGYGRGGVPALTRLNQCVSLSFGGRRARSWRVG